MDRRLSVYKKNGALLADITYMYDFADSGLAEVRTYMSIQEDQDGVLPTPMPIPSKLYKFEFTCPDLSSMDAVFEHDQQFIKAQLSMWGEPENLEFDVAYANEYNRRYVIGYNGTCYGIATISTYFSEDHKSVDFISAESMSLDQKFVCSALFFTKGIFHKLAGVDTGLLEVTTLPYI